MRIKDINYKDALLNTLYSQVEYLRQESLTKNEMIKSLIALKHSINCECSCNKNVNTECVENISPLFYNANIKIKTYRVQSYFFFEVFLKFRK